MTNAAQKVRSRDRGVSTPLMAIVDEALGVLEEERGAFLSGSFELIQGIAERKMSVLERLETTVPSAPRSANVVTAMKRLIAASRRNEQIIQAARQGLAHARRRLGAIAAASKGVVAYAEDGTKIASRADLISAGKSA